VGAAWVVTVRNRATGFGGDPAHDFGVCPGQYNTEHFSIVLRISTQELNDPNNFFENSTFTTQIHQSLTLDHEANIGGYVGAMPNKQQLTLL